MKQRKLYLLLAGWCVLSTACRHMEENKVEKYHKVENGTIPFLLGKYQPDVQPGFALIRDEYANKPDMRLQEEAYEAFLRMAAATEEAGYTLCIMSATRNFAYQKWIWENKWSGIFPVDGHVNACEAYPDGLTRARKIMEYSAMPGTSRHHWGTDIDLNALENDYFEDASKGKPLYEWLHANAAKFGFYQPYTPRNELRPLGYNEEKWHWSYLPLARDYTRFLAAHLGDNQVAGFMGDEYCDQLDIVNDYILGINPECK